MKPKINLLPPEIFNRIAAGEVIERPANVVKELVENSLDANSTEIVVEINSAGKKLVRVTDNGTGMTKEDLLLSIKPHATSKISKFEDIYNLTTLGFRGEALASIVSVSKTKIISKTQDSDVGYELIVYGGEIVSQTETASNNGTSVEVKELFYNTPARLKFLKSDYTEKVHIIRSLEEYCLSHKDVSFKLIVDGNLLLQTSKTDNIKTRIEEIIGRDIVKGLTYFEHQENSNLKIYGFISKLDTTQVNKSLQMFFVNNRPITSRLISQALYDAYRDSLPTGRHPVGIIFLEISPSEIDVNVHPTKRMIKFKSENTIYELLRTLIRSSFKKVLTQQVGFSRSAEIIQTKETQDKKSFEQTIQTPNSKISQSQPSTQNLTFTTQQKSASTKQPLKLKDYTYLGQLHKTYLLLETPHGLTIIDQHAASERIVFEQFLNSSQPGTQKLLIPINLELKISELEILKPYLDQINSLGFEITITGKNSVGISGIPSLLVIDDVKDFIKNFIENLISEIKVDNEKNVTSKEKIIRSACRAAIKANDILTLKDVEKLIFNLTNCEQPFTCPHGRPTILNIELPEIEKMFLRRK